MRDRVTFIHAADLHLDAPFSGLTAASDRIGKALAEATYEAFRRVIDTAIAREVDFVVIAGDAYNSRDKSLRAQLRFREQMTRLAEAGIEAFVVQGNHDPANGWSAKLALPDNVTVFSADRVGRAEVVRDGELVAAVYGRSFARRDVTENLSLGYRREASDPIAIGVLHTNVGSNADYETYAPATLDDLRAAGMDYWALGHIHKQEVLAENPWVVYSGSPQGINPKETGPHGCFVVDVSPSGAVSLEHVETAPVAWAHVTLDAGAGDRYRRRAFAARRAPARTCSRPRTARSPRASRSSGAATRTRTSRGQECCRSCSRTCASSRARVTRGSGSTGSTTARPRSSTSKRCAPERTSRPRSFASPMSSKPTTRRWAP